MASGVIKTQVRGEDYPGKMTGFILHACIVASSAGMILGYNIGISGGVTAMDSFLANFFPSVYNKKEDVSTNRYCKFDNQLLTLFTSSLYLAALVASIIASSMTRVLGRKWCMFVGGITSLVGAVINGAAKNVTMLIIGRILLGIGFGFANQSAPAYLFEMAPRRFRDTLNKCIQFQITIGILYANFVNYVANEIKDGWGWRISLGLVVIPALIITLGSLVLPDTPNSLIERGNTDEARQILVKIRGTEDINDEYQDLIVANEESQAIKHPWRNILQKKYRAQLTMAILLPLFQQLAGINVIMFYAPILFKTIGLGDGDSLNSTVIVGVINILGTVLSIVLVDRVERRAIFFQGGEQVFISQVIIGVMIYKNFGTTGTDTMPKVFNQLIIMFVCLYVAGFAWSWGPLGLSVPSEIFPLEIRSAGQNITMSVNLFFTFIIGQASLTMLCHLKFGLFFFFAGWVIIMTVFIYFFMPETKNVPAENMVFVWKQHWFWRKFINDDCDTTKKNN
ncbi:hypothetical protein LUZ60_017517 [Juncus effusus]|nr:hypothetical protein LUZ60_017517 [Juncus effusus]